MGQLRRLYSVLSVNPCHTTALAQGFIFQSAVRLQKKKTWYFSWKWASYGVFTASQRLWRWYGARMAFYRVPTLRSSCWRFSALSRRFHCAFTALTVQCVHCAFTCADGVLKTQWHLKERRTISVQTQKTTAAFAQRPLCAPAELLLRCRRPYCADMTTPRWCQVLS